MASFIGILLSKQAGGVYEILNAWLLVFVIVYAGLLKGKVFEGRKNIQTVLAAALAFITVSPHVTGAGFDVVPYITTWTPVFGAVLVALFLALLLAGAFGVRLDERFIAYVISVIIIIDILTPDLLVVAVGYWWLGGPIPGWAEFLFDAEFWAVALMAAVLIAVAGYIMREPKEKG
ncbi:hypothetical protein JXB02_04505 [Candidatus Woesearchaeota archaeon]|nr:hypothetical protein [Candidatus Woesearchaeota archaeon]